MVRHSKEAVLSTINATSDSEDEVHIQLTDVPCRDSWSKKTWNSGRTAKE